jgi:tetratricopeptide (TPR) repeat protein
MSQDKYIRRGLRVELPVSLAIAAVTLLVYIPSFHFPFIVFDDAEYVSQNAHVQAGLSAEGVRWAFTTFDCGNWHPLTWLSLQLDCETYGLNAGGFHATNVLLHTASTALLFLVLARLSASVWPSATVAALFALHPLHVESVVWVAERKDVLSTLFWMLTLAAYAYYVRRPGVGRYLLIVLALGLGLLAKPMLVTLPFVLLLLDFWPTRRLRIGLPHQMKEESLAGTPSPPASFRWLLLEKVPLFVLVFASCVVTFQAQLHGQAVVPVGEFPIAARVGNALLSYVGYLGKTLWPVHLAVYYPVDRHAAPGVAALAAGLFLAVLTALTLGPGRRWPYLAVGWLWFLGTLVPVIGLVQVGGQAMADRYTYVPLVGLFLFLVWGVTDAARAWGLPHHYLTAMAVAALSACAVLTWVQEQHWDADQNLWEHAVNVTEKNYMAHINLGTCYWEQGRHTAARAEFEKAVAIDPEAPIAHFNLGSMLIKLGQLEEALAEFRTAMDLDPEVTVPPNTLGTLLQNLGRLEEAEIEYRRAIDLDPKDAFAYHYMGTALADLGRSKEARAALGQALALAPEDARLHADLGRALGEAGNLEESLAEYRTALQMGDEQARDLLQVTERLCALRMRLPRLIAGQDHAANNTERIAFAELCRQPSERRYALAASLLAEAFRTEPQLANDMRAGHRFKAASAAAAAGSGQGKDGAHLDETERARLRNEALNWLRAELAAYTRYAQGGTAEARAAVQRALRSWKRSALLAGVRDQAALANLPVLEQEAWKGLWQDVEVLLRKASAPRNKP